MAGAALLQHCYKRPYFGGRVSLQLVRTNFGTEGQVTSNVQIRRQLIIEAKLVDPMSGKMLAT
ncbi:hypothetical protein F441_22782 [Phytophthora nicotianae CJ01A1]|uniref:Uncharacterized protein n=5 Tax=Phytophthora nicotianae TaxID=4792 RepID=V9DUE2_PHYNI|nr:hypothetical protein F443_22403 [Phytophthora nicotianae P1569]ETO75040.1 hypothetical protein F444_09332 [Phytophthora nicotianae P1976]ETO99794.1 hypothetical protein F441_22782 [Phytophthora nicotianae CJ01A1]ETP44224.1 hypothetical protein F442_09173 [Phytophthora nicotianae P10297]